MRYVSIKTRRVTERFYSSLQVFCKLRIMHNKLTGGSIVILPGGRKKFLHSGHRDNISRHSVIRIYKIFIHIIPYAVYRTEKDVTDER